MIILLSISLYSIMAFITVILTSWNYSKTNNIILESKNKQKISILIILIIATLFTIYNVFTTNTNLTISGDRKNYITNFYGVRETSSAGLMYVIAILKVLFGNVESLYYFSTFFAVAVILYAYRVCEEAKPASLLFLLTTQYVFFTFAGMKQCYAHAIGSLCIVLAMRHKGFKDTILCIALIFLATLFHPTGYLLIPLYIFLRIRKTKFRTIGLFIILLIVLFFLEPILLRSATALLQYVPSVSNKIFEYLGENSNLALNTSSDLQVLKGIPYYIITILGFVKRRQLKNKINNYDNYLLISGVMSLICVATIYNGWISRLGYYLYLVVAVFFVKVMQYELNQKKKLICYVSVVGLNMVFLCRYIVMMYLNYGCV